MRKDVKAENLKRGLFKGF